MIWTEDRIKAHLDGTVTRVLFSGEVITQLVSPGYIPKHSTNGGGSHAPRRVSDYRNWDENEDTILMELRRRGVTVAMIAEKLGRSVESVKSRITTLRIGR